MIGPRRIRVPAGAAANAPAPPPPPVEDKPMEEMLPELEKASVPIHGNDPLQPDPNDSADVAYFKQMARFYRMETFALAGFLRGLQGVAAQGNLKPAKFKRRIATHVAIVLSTLQSHLVKQVAVEGQNRSRMAGLRAGERRTEGGIILGRG